MKTGDSDIAEFLEQRLGTLAFSAAALRSGTLLGRWHAASEPLLPIYSLTKTYVATLVLLAVRAGRVDLEADVSGFCPDVPNAARITLRQLLNHTAGLPDYGALAEYQRAIASGAPVWSFDEFADQTYRRGSLFAPGTGWSYSNPGYALLVRILERTWQRGLDELLTDLICRPLDLVHTRIADTLDQAEIVPSTSRALSTDGTPRPMKTHYPVGWVWHRLIVSDAADSVRFLDRLLGDRWLGDRLTDAMLTLTPVGESHPPWTEPSYGLGLMGEPRGRRGAIYGHNGGGPGYSTSAFHMAATSTSVAIIAPTEATDTVHSLTLELHDRLTAR
ncbi:MAG: serine hydrolase domain-containing protein [Pseudomonadales bacterium]